MKRLAEDKKEEKKDADSTIDAQKFIGLSNKVRDMQRYGRRDEFAAEKSFIAVWSNSSRGWYISGRRVLGKGDSVNLDANEFLLPAKSEKEAKSYASKLPDHPLYYLSTEAKMRGDAEPRKATYIWATKQMERAKREKTEFPPKIEITEIGKRPETSKLPEPPKADLGKELLAKYPNLSNLLNSKEPPKEEKKPAEPPKEPFKISDLLNKKSEPAGPLPDWAEKRMTEKGELTPEETALARKQYYDQADVQRQTLERIMKGNIRLGPPKEEPKAEPKTIPGLTLIDSSPDKKREIWKVAEPEKPVSREKSLLDVWKGIQEKKGVPVEPAEPKMEAIPKLPEKPKAPGITFIGFDKGVEKYKVNAMPLKSTASQEEVKPPEFSGMAKPSSSRIPEIKPPETSIEADERAESFMKRPIQELTASKPPAEIIPGISARRKEEPPEMPEMIQLTAKDTKSQVIPFMQEKEFRRPLPGEEIPPTQVPSITVEQKVADKMGAASAALTKKDIMMKEKEVKDLEKEKVKFGIWEEKQYGKTMAKVERWAPREERGAPFFTGKYSEEQIRGDWPKTPTGTERATATQTSFERFQERAEKPWQQEFLEERGKVVGQRLRETWLGKPAVREMRQDVRTGQMREITVEAGKPGIFEKFASKALTPRKLRHLPTIPSMKRERDPRITEQWQRKKYFG